VRGAGESIPVDGFDGIDYVSVVLPCSSHVRLCSALLHDGVVGMFREGGTVVEAKGVAAPDDEALQAAGFHAVDLEQVFHGGAALDGDGVGEAPAVVAAELHASLVGEVVEVAGFGDHVSGLGDVFLPLLDAAGEFFG
jgi:hypothetical protein